MKNQILETQTVCLSLKHSLQRTVPVQSYRFSSTCRAMSCSPKTDEILLYENDELVLFNVNGTLVSRNERFPSDFLQNSDFVDDD